MDKRVAAIAKELSAEHVGTLPAVRGDAFGMARLARLMQLRLTPSAGKRPGRPTNSAWTEHRKVPMSASTLASLKELSAQFSSDDRRISPMQLAAQLLEESVVQVAAASRKRSRRRTI